MVWSGMTTLTPPCIGADLSRPIWKAGRWQYQPELNDDSDARNSRCRGDAARRLRGVDFATLAPRRAGISPGSAVGIGSSRAPTRGVGALECARSIPGHSGIRLRWGLSRLVSHQPRRIRSRGLVAGPRRIHYVAFGRIRTDMATSRHVTCDPGSRNRRGRSRGVLLDDRRDPVANVACLSSRFLVSDFSCSSLIHGSTGRRPGIITLKRSAHCLRSWQLGSCFAGGDGVGFGAA